MKNALTTLRIQNFKSIKDVELTPRRVNLIIGEPNVGKSNILEAMSLLGGLAYEQTDKFMGSFIRYEEPRQLFYDNIVANQIRVLSSWGEARLTAHGNGTTFYYIAGKAGKPASQKEFVRTWFDKTSTSSLRDDTTAYVADPDILQTLPFRSYIFSKNTPLNHDFPFPYLNPPYGDNLLNIIQTTPALRKDISRFFAHYNQKMKFRTAERQVEIINERDGIEFSYPYSSVADTLQRIIFYLAAIESNDDAVILLEEPEAHSYPVYVAKLGRRIVESRNNQFFVATHSPYLITEVLEKMLTDDAQAGELAIFAAYYDDHQTKIHALSDEEIRSIRADGIDVFYNMSRFTTGAARG